MTIDSHLVSSIRKGLLVFAAVAAEDTKKEVESMAEKVLKMKLWPDETGAMVRSHDSHIYVPLLYNSRSGNETYKKLVARSSVVCRCCMIMQSLILRVDALIVVSQFTLLASTKKGNKPNFHGAASGQQAKELYDHFFSKVEELYDPDKVKNGVFQAMMDGRPHDS